MRNRRLKGAATQKFLRETVLRRSSAKYGRDFCDGKFFSVSLPRGDRETKAEERRQN